MRKLKTLADRQTARATVADITSAQNQGQKMLWQSPGSNFVKGAAFVALTMVADHYLDKILLAKITRTVNQQQHDGTNSAPLVA